MALTSGQSAPWARHGSEKYAKFAYSTAFGFSVPVGKRDLNQLAGDSMLALSDDGHSYRIREEVLEFKYEHGALYSRWQPMPHVEVETWLISIAPWHLRVHHIQTSQTIWTAEGAFAINREDDHPLRPSGLHESGQGFAWGRYPSGASGIRDLLGQCDGQNVYAEPNSNLIAQRTLLPTLTKQLDTGEHWLACAVLASTNVQYWQQMWEQVPNLPEFVEAMMSR